MYNGQNKMEEKYKPNYPLLLLLLTIPLQNLYLGKLPTLGMGINYLNVVFVLSFLTWRTRKDLAIPTESSLKKPLIIFIFVYIISLFVGIINLGELGENDVQALKDILIPLVLYFIVLNSVRDYRGIIWVLVATIVPLPYMFRVFYSQLTSVLHWHYSDVYRNVSGTFMELGSNEIAAFYAGYTPMLIALVIFIKNTKFRIFVSLFIILNLYSLMYSFSRGSWLSFLIAISVMTFVANKKTFITILLIFILSSGAIFSMMPVSVQERFSTIFVESEDQRDESAESRFVLWDIAMGEFIKSPIIGIGFHVFHRVNPYGGKDTHNYFVKILTEQGIVGLSVLLLILYRGAKISFKLYRIATEPLFKAIGIGMMGVISAFLVGNMFGDRMSHYPLIAYFWAYLALAQRALIISQDNTNPKTTVVQK
jgi:O-antigen ligase